MIFTLFQTIWKPKWRQKIKLNQGPKPELNKMAVKIEIVNKKDGDRTQYDKLEKKLS